jgi:hypothetical protein
VFSAGVHLLMTRSMLVCAFNLQQLVRPHTLLDAAAKTVPSSYT